MSAFAQNSSPSQPTHNPFSELLNPKPEALESSFERLCVTIPVQREQQIREIGDNLHQAANYIEATLLSTVKEVKNQSSVLKKLLRVLHKKPKAELPHKMKMNIGEGKTAVVRDAKTIQENIQHMKLVKRLRGERK